MHINDNHESQELSSLHGYCTKGCKQIWVYTCIILFVLKTAVILFRTDVYQAEDPELCAVCI